MNIECTSNRKTNYYTFQEESIKKLRDSTEEWKGKARDLQTQLDEIKAKYHDLEKEHKVGLRHLQKHIVEDKTDNHLVSPRLSPASIISMVKFKHSDWLFRVLWPFSTN